MNEYIPSLLNDFDKTLHLSKKKQITEDKSVKNKVEILLEHPGKHPFHLELEKNLDENIIGQEKAKNEIITAILSKLLNFRDRKGPIATLFFRGPTGVGKTEIVKSLAEYLLGNKNNFTKISCENYMEGHSSSTLFGAPKSYVGYDDESPISYNNITKYYQSAKKMGQLNDNIIQLEGFNIILFDEVDKAHYQVKQSLLGLMDDGKVEFTDGTVSHYNNSIIIFTSNIGQHDIDDNESSNIGFIKSERGDDSDLNTVEKRMKKDFSPEFRNRLTSIVDFEYLSNDDCIEIIKKEINSMNVSLSQYYVHSDISIKLEDDVINEIVEGGFSKEKGARMLLRGFENKIERELNLIINSESFEDYFDLEVPIIINVKLIKGEIKFYIEYINNGPKINKEEDNSENLEEQTEIINVTGVSKLRELNTHFIEISKYIEMYNMNIDGTVDFRKDLKIAEKKLKSYGFTREDIVLMRNRAYLEELNQLHFITNFEGISIFNKEKKDIFHPYSQRVILNIVDKFIEKNIDEIINTENAGLYVLEQVVPIIEKILKDRELSSAQMSELMVYVRKIIMGKYM